jgi:hypothetical protein
MDLYYTITLQINQHLYCHLPQCLINKMALLTLRTPTNFVLVGVLYPRMWPLFPPALAPTPQDIDQ